jgi:hypothetical protein
MHHGSGQAILSGTLGTCSCTCHSPESDRPIAGTSPTLVLKNTVASDLRANPRGTLGIVEAAAVVGVPPGDINALVLVGDPGRLCVEGH